MKISNSSSKRGFTLVETIIAIGVLTVLLTAFVIVFTPAAAGIRKSISLQEADRLTSTLEKELVALRGKSEQDTFVTGFGKAYEWIKKSNKSATTDALLVYQYRASLTDAARDDGTRVPVAKIGDKLAGKDYMLQSMVRRKNDTLFAADLAAVEGGVYLVKCTQLVTVAGTMQPKTAGKIFDNTGTTEATSADAFPDAVISFTADFYALPQKTSGYFSSGGFDKSYQNLKKPIFSRNLAVRR